MEALSVQGTLFRDLPLQDARARPSDVVHQIAERRRALLNELQAVRSEVYASMHGFSDIASKNAWRQVRPLEVRLAALGASGREISAKSPRAWLTPLRSRHGKTRAARVGVRLAPCTCEQIPHADSCAKSIALYRLTELRDPTRLTRVGYYSNGAAIWPRRAEQRARYRELLGERSAERKDRRLVSRLRRSKRFRASLGDAFVRDTP
jgi:hypothetical protein